MSKVLLDKLMDDLDPQLKLQLTKTPELLQFSQDYLRDLFDHEDLLSTDSFTTTTTIPQGDGQRLTTLTEEIAELDDQQRTADVKLARITNDNRDAIIDISQNLKHINQTITSEMKSEVESMIKILSTDEVNDATSINHGRHKFEVKVNDQLTNSIDINSSLLSNIDSILDLLELPTLCKICILQGNYQEALDISLLSKTLIAKFPTMNIFIKINEKINKELNLMIKNLIKLLNTNLKQNNLIKIFNILNQLDLINLKNDLINNHQTMEKTRFLKLIFLNSRFKFIINEISTLKPLVKFNKLTYLKRFIEVFRSEIYHSISMFYSIINHSLNLVSNKAEDDLLINQFVKSLAYLLIDELKLYLPEILTTHNNDNNEFDDHHNDIEIDIKNQLDGLILQIIYLCKSLAKYHSNFENIITWELCYNQELIKESDWLDNLSKVKTFRN